MERQLRKTKEKAIERGKWQGRGGPKGSYRVSENLPSGYDSDMDFPKDRKASPGQLVFCQTAVCHRALPSPHAVTNLVNA